MAEALTPAAKNGWLGERLAARYLRRRGYAILDANYRTRQGEVDIIAKAGSTLVFCEVKTRTPQMLSLPREAVGEAKQRRLVAAALTYVKQNQITNNLRFDVLEVLLNDNGKAEITHIPNAFTAERFGLFGV